MLLRSETDAESLASFSTQISTSSHYTYHSDAPSPRVLTHPSPPFPKPSSRTLSSSSYTSHLAPPSITSSSSAQLHESPLQRLSSGRREGGGGGRHLGIPRPERDREQLRARHRAEREKRSTLAAEKFDSPLRRWLRWMSSRGLSGWTLGVGLVGVGMVKTGVGFGGFSGMSRSLCKLVLVEAPSRDEWTPSSWDDLDSLRPRESLSDETVLMRCR